MRRSTDVRGGLATVADEEHVRRVLRRTPVQVDDDGTAGDADMSVSSGLSLDKGSSAYKAYELEHRGLDAEAFDEAVKEAHYRTRGHALEVSASANDIHEADQFHETMAADNVHDQAAQDMRNLESVDEGTEFSRQMAGPQKTAKEFDAKRIIREEERKASKTRSKIDDDFVEDVLPGITEAYVDDKTAHVGAISFPKGPMSAAKRAEKAIKKAEDAAERDGHHGRADPDLPREETDGHADADYGDYPRRYSRRHRI